MVQQETLSPPVQLASEGVQLVVWLLAENQTCKNRGTDGELPTLCVCLTLAVAHAASSAGISWKRGSEYSQCLPLKATRASSVG